MAARIARINGKLYDIGTPNKSFLQVAKDLQVLGIKNYYFMLEICDPSLININPYAVNEKTGKSTLTQDQVSRIFTECLRNPWYYLRELSRIPDQGGTYVQYIANRGNIAQAWCIRHGLDSWLCLRRQKGKTQSALAMEAWMYLFGTTNSQFIFVNKDGDNAKTNLKRLVDQIELLPEYMHFDYIIDEDGHVEKGKSNATQITCPVNGNSIITKNKATSREMALSLARGLTAPVLHFDEPEFTPHIGTIVANSASTFDQAARNAKRNNAMYGRIFTCTPGDLDTKMGMEAQLILDKTARWTEKMYDWDEKQIEEYMMRQGKDCNKILYIEYSYKQTGDTEEWLADISAKIGDPLTVRREILLQRLHGSSLSPFDQEDIEFIVESQHKAIDSLWLMDYYEFKIYKKLERNIPYMVGVDCSTGTNGDNNSITILNPFTLEPDAEFECSYIGETLFEQLLKELVKVIPRCVLIIERNSVGDGIIDHLLHSEISSRLYYDKAKDLQGETMRGNETVESMLRKQASLKTYYGVYTSTNRETMMSILARHVNEYKEKFVAEYVIRDLSRLIRKPNGKIEAGPGFHDDAVMSYLMCLYIWYHGNNLSMFGINKGEMGMEPENQGTKRPQEIDRSMVSEKIIQDAIRLEEKEMIAKQENDWDSLLKQAMIRSQKQTYELSQSNMISDTIFDTSTEAVVDSYYEEDSIPMDFFDTMNGLK